VLSVLNPALDSPLCSLLPSANSALSASSALSFSAFATKLDRQRLPPPRRFPISLPPFSFSLHSNSPARPVLTITQLLQSPLPHGYVRSVRSTNSIPRTPRYEPCPNRSHLQATSELDHHLIHALFHVGASPLSSCFPGRRLAVAVVLYASPDAWALAMGYHRLLHPSRLQDPRVDGILLTTCGTLALEGGPIAWVATHRIHPSEHRQRGDPTPRKTAVCGRTWDVIISGKAMHQQKPRNSCLTFPILRKHNFICDQQIPWVPISALAVITLAFGGLSVMMWAVFLRTFWDCTPLAR